MHATEVALCFSVQTVSDLEECVLRINVETVTSRWRGQRSMP